MADRTKYFRDYQAKIREKAKKFDELAKVDPFAKGLVSERIGDLSKAITKARKKLESAMANQDSDGLKRALKILKDAEE